MLDLGRLLAETGRQAVTVNSSAGGLDLMGGALNDRLQALGGGSTFSGGHGDDTLIGAGGGNRYLYELGDGTDRITNIRDDSLAVGQPLEAPDSLVFGEGIRPEDLTLTLGSLAIRVGSNAGDVIHLEGFDPADALGPQPLQRFEFADGQVLGWADLLARGFDVAETAANDAPCGLAGDAVYVLRQSLCHFRWIEHRRLAA